MRCNKAKTLCFMPWSLIPKFNIAHNLGCYALRAEEALLIFMMTQKMSKNIFKCVKAMMEIISINS